jgi:hypothetical protein
MLEVIINCSLESESDDKTCPFSFINEFNDDVDDEKLAIDFLFSFEMYREFDM